jgi:hypothetical protein
LPNPKDERRLVGVAHAKAAIPESAIGFQRSSATRLVLLLADGGRERRRLWDTQSIIQRPKIGVRGMWGGGRIRSRAIVVQQKTGRPVQFELLEPTRGSILAWLEHRGGTLDEFVFPSRITPIISALGNTLDLLMSG